MENGVSGPFTTRRPVPSQGHRPRPHDHHTNSLDQPAATVDSTRSSAAANLQAVPVNGSSSGGEEHLVGSEDPDDFYRDYRGFPQFPDAALENTTYGMQTSASEARSTQASVRSNANGTAPKYSSLSNSRAALRPAHRSASAPVDENMAVGASKSGYNQSQPSVKDLLKRFDASGESTSPVSRKPVPRAFSRDASASGPGYMRSGTGGSSRIAAGNQFGSQIPRGPSNNGVKSPTAAKTTQRTRFASVDQPPAQPTQPRTLSTSGDLAASKSMTNLSPTSSARSKRAIPRRPLFGEVLPEGGSGVGFGIPRPDPASSNQTLTTPSSLSHRRSFSDVGANPPSPTAWYLESPRGLEQPDAENSAQALRRHNRAHSDSVDPGAHSLSDINASSFLRNALPTPNEADSRPPISTPRTQYKSKIPRKNSSASSSSSSRANSPFSTHRLANSRQPESMTRSAAGRTTPSRPSAQRYARNSGAPTQINTSLKAYISAPPPKLSPPLRSSRPRQHVSSASTTSSRQKQVDKSPPQEQAGTGMRITRTGSPEERRAKKIVDVGPIDFAARRERIQRAYTKSIHESEQKEIRAANLRRLRERQEKLAAAKAQEEMSEEMAAQATDAGSAPDVQSEPSFPEDITPQQTPQINQPLQINTSFFPASKQVFDPLKTTASPNQDSPTLGMPGSFIAEDEPPRSAISIATATTEFDNEPQTEAPRFTLNGLTASPMQSSPTEDADAFYRASSFDLFRHALGNHDEGSIQIMLDASQHAHIPAENTPTNSSFEIDPAPPGAFQDTPVLERDEPVFNSTVTAASPELQTQRGLISLDSLHDDILDDSHSESCDDSLMEQSGQSDMHHGESPFERYSDPELHVEDAPHLELPMLRRALSPPSPTSDISAQDSPHTMDPVHFDDDETMFQDDHGRFAVQETTHNDASEAYRASRESSTWTDCSLDSVDACSEAEEESDVAIVHSPNGTKRKPVGGENEVATKPVLTLLPETGLLSPQDMGEPTPRFKSPNWYGQQPQNSALQTLMSPSMADPSPFGVISEPPMPDYFPPPVPQYSGESSPAHSLRSPPQSGLYNIKSPSFSHSSQADLGQTFDSRRNSGEAFSGHQSLSTPRSSTQVSFEDVSATQSLELKPKAETEETEEERKISEKLKKRLYQRQMLIKELIDTESIYLKDMNVVEEIYKGTAEACPKLDEQDIKIIFRNSNEIVAFSTKFLDDLKAASSSVYSRSKSSRLSRATTGASTAAASLASTSADRLSIAPTLNDESDEQKDARTTIGSTFNKHLKGMFRLYMDFLKNSELANTRLAALMTDSAVKLWLNECNLVAKDLTGAWDLDALLVKPVQRITRYQLLLTQLLNQTKEGHPDYVDLQICCRELASLLKNIDDMKRRIHMVGKIVNRKRKDTGTDVRAGIAKAFGRRTERLQSAAGTRHHDDEAYVKLHEKFGDDYLRLQVVLRDIEFYTRQVKIYVSDFLRFLSAIELMMRMSATSYPEIESKWAHFNMSMRDMETVVMEEHVSAVRKRVIEPFELVIQTYGAPSQAMKKRAKRRLDYEKFIAAKEHGKKIDEKLSEQAEQYDALNETLKEELPKLSAMTEKIANICLAHFVMLQAQWYGIWVRKVAVVLEEAKKAKEITDIIEHFQRDYKYVLAQAQELSIVNGKFHQFGFLSGNTRTSLSSKEWDASKPKGRPSDISTRSRGVSVTSDQSPSIPTPDFAKRFSGQLMFSPLAPYSPASYTPTSQAPSHSRAGSITPAATPATVDYSFSSRPSAPALARTGTSRSQNSDYSVPRMSTDSHHAPNRRESSNSTAPYVDGPLQSQRPYSGLFSSAMPLPDGPEESARSSRASSRDRNFAGGFNVLYLAASLFEFNISATKSEAGYPYLTYTAGEIFDVIGEKGELWLAKNQDDPSFEVGWIWSKHFARLAND